MRIIPPVLPRNPRTTDETRTTLGYLLDVLSRFFDDIARLVSGRISFGDGTKLDNIFGYYADITAGGTPDVEFSVSHSTGKVPGGFIVLWQDRAGSLYKGGTAWTSSTLYLKSSVANLQARIFVI